MLQSIKWKNPLGEDTGTFSRVVRAATFLVYGFLWRNICGWMKAKEARCALRSSRSQILQSFQSLHANFFLQICDRKMDRNLHHALSTRCPRKPSRLSRFSRTTSGKLAPLQCVSHITPSHRPVFLSLLRLGRRKKKKRHYCQNESRLSDQSKFKSTVE